MGAYDSPVLTMINKPNKTQYSSYIVNIVKVRRVISLLSKNLLIVLIL